MSAIEYGCGSLRGITTSLLNFWIWTNVLIYQLKKIKGNKCYLKNWKCSHARNVKKKKLVYINH